ncbi:HlyD family secretion protein [Brevundimonas sp. TWP2-3-2]|uniref:HlyD family secretion protein n=1 Tax=unclassified Brevundimonas TaxID=2622653 RepID=UPI003CF92511
MMGLFRPEAVEAKRRRLWGEVRLAQPPSLVIWTAVLTALCVFVFAALIFGHFTRKETVQGFLLPEAGIVQVTAVQAGRVSRVLVREGQSVEEGASIIEFTSDVSSLGQGPVLDVQLAETERQRAALDDRQDALSRGYESDQERLRDQIAAQNRLQQILLQQRAVQADALALSEADTERLARLQAQGYAPAVEVDRRRRTVLAERTALADLDARISQSEATSAELRSQLAALPARLAEATARVASDAASVAQRRAELQVARRHQLLAPIAGTISSLQARPGMTPAADLPLLSISPDGSPLEARLLVPTRASGFLKVGQTTRLQIEAFPFQRFGFVEGRILDVTRTVIRPGEALFPIQQTEAVYEVRVSLSRDYVDAYGERLRLQPGMALRADIPIDRRTLWQFLFDPILASGKRAG